MKKEILLWGLLSFAVFVGSAALIVAVTFFYEPPPLPEVGAALLVASITLFAASLGIYQKIRKEIEHGL